MKKLRVDIWSDIACPWCFIGKRRLEAALARFSHKDDVEVTWRAFELDPSAPRERDPKISYATRLAKKYGSSETQAQGRLDSMTETARADGLDFRFDRIRSGNTFDAHRVLHLAHEHDKQDAMKERLLAGYLEQGEPIGDPETLARLGGDVGLDPEEVHAMLATDRFVEEVRAEESQALELGIGGVPFFVFGGKYAVSGAQPPEVLLSVLERAWKELPKAPEVFAEGATCGPDGCV